MYKEEGMQLQNRFLETLCEKSVPVSVFLMNGVKLQGKIVRFDEVGVLLERSKHTQLVYRHAISTVTPPAHFDFSLA